MCCNAEEVTSVFSVFSACCLQWAGWPPGEDWNVPQTVSQCSGRTQSFHLIEPNQTSSSPTEYTVWVGYYSCQMWLVFWLLLNSFFYEVNWQVQKFTSFFFPLQEEEKMAKETLKVLIFDFAHCESSLLLTLHVRVLSLDPLLQTCYWYVNGGQLVLQYHTVMVNELKRHCWFFLVQLRTFRSISRKATNPEKLQIQM